jgi:hypothetical protein
MVTVFEKTQGCVIAGGAAGDSDSDSESDSEWTHCQWQRERECVLFKPKGKGFANG